MSKMTALLFSNTSVNFKEMSGEDFMNTQEIVKDPVVLFCNLETTESFERFDIVAQDMDELSIMYETKVFYTSSIPEGSTRQLHGALFYGVSKDYDRKEKRRSAATERLDNGLS